MHDKQILLRRYSFVFFTYCLIFSFGYVIAYLTVKRNTGSSLVLNELRLQENYKFINPLLECDANIANFKQITVIKSEVENYITTQTNAGTIKDAAVYYRDLNNGPWFGIKESTLFTPASLTKVPLMMTYFKKAEHDPSILKQELVVDVAVAKTAPPTFNSPRSLLVANRKYTTDTLIRHMIINSDNTAYLVLKNNLTTNEFHKVFDDLGINSNSIRASKTGDVLSIREYSSFFRILYNSSYLNRDYSEKALKLLSETKFNSGLVAGIPHERVSHKFGERYYEDANEKQLHDCGIVYMKQSPYLICIMTRGTSFDDLSTVIAGISSIVYTELQSQLNKQ
jgi:beta-lactamase class A